MNLRSLALAVLLALTGCPGGNKPAARDALDDVKARGKLVVAMDVGYDPFEVLSPEGKPVGYDVDVVNEVAADLGVQVELQNTAWDGIIPTLQTGKVDAIFSGMSITEERRRAVAFSDPYYAVGQVVVKKKGDGRIKGFKDLDDAQMRVATQQGTTGEQAIVRFMPKAQLMQFAKTDEACVALSQGKCDAVVFDHPFLIKYVTLQSTDLEGLWEPFTSEDIAAAVRMDSQKLLDAINRTIARLKQSGKLAELQAKWFPKKPGQ
jgi:polar amino acid transport system substrate-binding protein